MPSRSAAAIACGTSASASTTLARISCTAAFISCSMRNGHRAALLGLGLSYAAVGFRLIHLQLCADVAAHVNVRDVDGQYLKRGARVQALAEHGSADKVGVFKYLLMRWRQNRLW